MTTSAAKVHHPLFARFYAALSASAEAHGVADHREELLAGASGTVIEVGAGTGANFSHYPDSVAKVIAVEPEAHLRSLAQRTAYAQRRPIEVVDGVAQALPAQDSSADVGVASLVLCSVPDQRAALEELWRVIKPGGELRFYEHVRADAPRWARRQDLIDHVWPIFGGGCHCNRDTVRAIEEAGFVIETCRRFLFRPCFVCAPVAPIAIGRARRP